jgi:hypothetical protein
LEYESGRREPAVMLVQRQGRGAVSWRAHLWRVPRACLQGGSPFLPKLFEPAYGFAAGRSRRSCGAVATLVLAAIGTVIAARRRSGMATAGMAMVLALIALGSLGALVWKAARVPRIHDVTTDTDPPPQFVAVLPSRAKSQGSGFNARAET